MRSFEDISHYTVEIHRLENDGDRLSREAMASLFDTGVDPMFVIRWKDIFERLEEAIDATERVADVLQASSSRTRSRDSRGRDIILVIVVATALAFDFTNGFHDTANAVATSISTRAMSPRAAVAMAAVLNFVGAFISLEVAATVASGIVQAEVITTTIVFAGLIGAIAWNLATWYFGLPSSSSHALIGGVAGAAFVAAGPDAVLGAGLLEKVIVPALVAPLLAFLAAGLAILIAYRIIGRLRPGPVNRGYRAGQIISGSLFSLAHGTNDAQKTMGIITLALIANGNLSAEGFEVPLWVIVSSATAIALGTYSGGWRIIRTMGSRIIKMDPAQGFSAQGSGAAVLLTATHLGFPLSTTHTISGAVMGAGAARRLSAVRWGVAGNIALAWVLTLPSAAAIGALAFGMSPDLRHRRAGARSSSRCSSSASSAPPSAGASSAARP
jgi:PiT family inorganic phosphate transporter